MYIGCGIIYYILFGLNCIHSPFQKFVPAQPLIMFTLIFESVKPCFSLNLIPYNMFSAYWGLNADTGDRVFESTLGEGDRVSFGKPTLEERIG